MTTTVSTHEASVYLFRLLALVAAGEEVTIMQEGRPIAKLVPFASPPAERKLGFARGMITRPGRLGRSGHVRGGTRRMGERVPTVDSL